MSDALSGGIDVSKQVVAGLEEFLNDGKAEVSAILTMLPDLKSVRRQLALVAPAPNAEVLDALVRSLVEGGELRLEEVPVRMPSESTTFSPVVIRVFRQGVITSSRKQIAPLLIDKLTAVAAAEGAKAK